jgi:hypothetical protein
MTGRQLLHLVDRAPPAPRYAVRVSAFSSMGGPHGRSRKFRLSDEDLERLLDLAVRLENRGRQ